MGSHCLVGLGFSLEETKHFCNDIIVVVAQHCEGT